jgi:alkaline phosphatase
MKSFLFCMLLIATGYPLAAQPRIHAHNDYQQALPLTNALSNRVYSIEADVYLRNGQLVVAHDAKDVAAAPTLDSLYLQPIIRLFKKYHGRISKSKTYTPVLMIDSKESGAAVIAQLIKAVEANGSVFNRLVNAMAVQLVISGDRAAVSTWASYPSYIFFDGRPAEVYDSATLKRLAFISDNYTNYVSKQDSSSRIEALVKKVHGMGKLLRLWAIPDTAASWRRLQQLGVDIINTDKVVECRGCFLNAK